MTTTSPDPTRTDSRAPSRSTSRSPLPPAGRHGRPPRRRGQALTTLALAALVVVLALLGAAFLLARPPVGAPASTPTPAPPPNPTAPASDPPANPAPAPVAPSTDGLSLTATPTWDGDVLVVPVQVRSAAPAGAPGVRVHAGDQTVPATVTLTAAGVAPVRTAVLVVDTSGSMGPAGIGAARAAALRYADAVGGEIRVGLVSFADTATVLTPPTTDRTALRAGLDRLTPRGETALYDALVLAVDQAGHGGNVVLLSDGGDTVSTASLDRVVTAVSHGQVRLDAVAFRTAESERDALESVARAGGGRVLQAADAGGLGRAFAAAASAVPVDLTIRADLTGLAEVPSRLAAELSLAPRTYAGQVEVPSRPVAAEPTAPAPPGRMTPQRLAAGAFVGLGLLVLLLAWPRRVRPGQRRDTVLAAYGDPLVLTAGAGPDRSGALTSTTAGVLAVTDRMLTDHGRRSEIALRLDRAGLTLLPHEWVVLRAGIVLAAAAGLFLLATPRWLGLLLGAGLGWGASEVWLRWRQDRRCRAFADQLPDTLQVVASSLRSGFALPQSLAATQENALDPMASELGRALAAARLGVDLDDELEAIAVRMRSEDWRLAVMAIRIQRSVGGSLAEVLGSTARTLRERAALVRQVRALSAEGRLSAYVLLALPFGVGGFMLAFRRSYLDPLWTTVPGVVMLAGAVVGMVVGTIWMFKVATVEV